MIFHPSKYAAKLEAAKTDLALARRKKPRTPKLRLRIMNLSRLVHDLEYKVKAFGQPETDEDRELKELITRRRPRGEHFEDDPAYHRIIERRIAAMQQTNMPGRGRATESDRTEYGFDGPGIRECPFPAETLADELDLG